MRWVRSFSTPTSAFEGDAKPAVRRLSIVIILLLLTVSGAADETVTLRGEIADTFCIAARGISGPAHTACAIQCARKGIPLALVEEKTHRTYVLLPPKDISGLPEEVIGAAGTVHTVTGRMFVSGGTRFLTVDSIR
jgi:hypothetical protein